MDEMMRGGGGGGPGRAGQDRAEDGLRTADDDGEPADKVERKGCGA